MGDKSPPMCPGFALRSTARWKMPQTPSPVDLPTAHQMRYRKVEEKSQSLNFLFYLFFIFFLSLQLFKILPESLMTKLYHFHKSIRVFLILHKISQG